MRLKAWKCLKCTRLTIKDVVVGLISPSQCEFCGHDELKEVKLT